jgi:non-heme chloroperoxidase
MARVSSIPPGAPASPFSLSTSATSAPASGSFKFPRFECITYDQRGFDRSDVYATDYSIETLVDLDALIRHLDRPKLSAVTLSFGGYVLARYLRRHGSERVKRAALVSTVASFPCRSEDNPDGLDPEQAYETFLRGMIEDRAQTFLDSLDLLFNPGGAENPVTEGARTWIMNLGLCNPLVSMLEIYRASFSRMYAPT